MPPRFFPVTHPPLRALRLRPKIPPTPRQQQQQHRSFITLPGTATNPQTLTAARTLPYPAAPLYEIIANIDSYAAFVPYCTSSTVTHWSPPDPRGRRWPAQATLRVGWGGFEETFASRVRCQPDALVEARSGEGVVGAKAGAVFRSLVTRWTFRPSSGQRGRTLGGHARGDGNGKGAGEGSGEGTEVNLSIQFEFTNPLYSAVSAAVSDRVAATMIEAFENHAKKLLDKEGRI